MNDLTTEATKAAVLGGGFRHKLLDNPLASTFEWVDNPFARPGPQTRGFNVDQRGAADLEISLCEDLRRRTVYFVIDPESAPLTGDYNIELNDVVVPYDATAEAPETLTELLEGIASFISEGGFEAVAVRYRRDGETQVDAVRVRPALSAAIEASQTPEGASYVTMTVGADTSAPAAAQLVVARELTGCKARLFARTDRQTGAGFGEVDTIAQAAKRSGWARVTDKAWTLDADNLDRRIDISGRTAVMPLLYDRQHPDAVATVSSGDGVYGIHDEVYMAVTTREQL